MSGNEIKFFKQCLEQCQSSYFEWGCGGSTCAACDYRNIHKVISVESSLQWIGKVMNVPAIASAIRAGGVNFIYIDINADETNYGRPKDTSKRANWPQYSRAIKRNLNKYGLILIDGRFRVACALHALDHIEANGLMLVHDYTNRPHYHCIEQFYDKVAAYGTLTAFKKKSEYDHTQLLALIKKYELICD